METGKSYPASIIKAIHAVMTKVEYVVKDGKNEFHKYRYASEAALIAALRPVMLEEGLVIIPSGEELLPVDEWGITHIVLSYTLTHISGDVWPDKIKAFGAGSDKSGKRKDDTFTVGDKGTYKAITGAYKYFIKNLFQLETGTDPEKDGTKEKKGSPKTTTETNGNGDKLVNAAQIKRFHAIKRDFEWTDPAAKSLLVEFGYESTKEMEAWEAYGAIIKKLQKGMDGKARADAKGYCIFANGKDKEKDSK
jgi:hypothetical protein